MGARQRGPVRVESITPVDDDRLLMALLDPGAFVQREYEVVWNDEKSYEALSHWQARAVQAAGYVRPSPVAKGEQHG